MKKNLIFYWYIPESLILPDIYQLHIYNLKKYSKIFSTATFILGIDDLSKVDKIEKTKSLINDLGFSCNIDFLIYQNNENIRECNAFYNEFVMKLKYLEGPTFFAHSKGITRKGNSTVPLWNTGLYYFNLNDIKSVENELSKKNIFSYGVFKKEYEWTIYENNRMYKQRYNWHYSGTFFWIDPQKIYKYITTNNIALSTDFHRWYAEMWLGNIFDSKYAYTKYELISEEDLYNKCDKVLEEKMKVPKKELTAFNKYYNNMVKELNKIGISYNIKDDKKQSATLTFTNPNVKNDGFDFHYNNRLIFK